MKTSGTFDITTKCLNYYKEGEKIIFKRSKNNKMADARECPVCFNKLTLDNAMSWRECSHSLCRDCFINSAVIYAFENQSVKVECPLCRVDINHITGGADLMTVDLWTKLFRTVRRKKCRICGERNSPTPVVSEIDSCDLHKEVCLDCGIKNECKPPGCFFLKCIICKEKGTTPNFVGCYYCGTCPGHVKEESIRSLILENPEHRKLVGLCSKCYNIKLLCKNHWSLPKTIAGCVCKN